MHILESDKISWELLEGKRSWTWQWMARCGEGRGGRRRSRVEEKREEMAAGEGVEEVDGLPGGEGGRGGSQGEECGEREVGEEEEDDQGQLEGEHQFHLDQTAWKSEIIRINIFY